MTTRQRILKKMFRLAYSCGYLKGFERNSKSMEESFETSGIAEEDKLDYCLKFLDDCSGIEFDPLIDD